MSGCREIAILSPALTLPVSLITLTSFVLKDFTVGVWKLVQVNRTNAVVTNKMYVQKSWSFKYEEKEATHETVDLVIEIFVKQVK